MTEGKNFVVLVKTEKDLKKLEGLLNSGYEIETSSQHQRDNGTTQTYWILGKPKIKAPIQQPKQIEAFRIVKVKDNTEYINETVFWQIKGFEIESVTATSCILVKYKETK